MKFSNTLEATMLPEWRQHYIDYKALKKVLKQARLEHDQGVDFLAASPQTASLSVARSYTAAAAAVNPAPGSTNLLQQQQQALNEDIHQQHMSRQAGNSSSGTSSTFIHSITPFSTAQEQFLQMLQQELTKVQNFIHLQAASLSAALEALAAAAPQLAGTAWQDLESQARDLGQQLLALEGFVQQNQAGFVKIVKKHDKYVPESPIWHLYLHHVLRSPWLDEQQQQFMWAALSSCYYHLHASMLSRRRSRRRGHSSRRQQQQQQQQTSTSDSSDQQQRAQQQQQQRQQQQQEGTSGRRFGGILPVIGSAVTAAAATAAAAAAGAATAVAGAATAVAAATRSTVTTTNTAPEISSMNTATGTVNINRKFWVAQENVSAITYLILQHLPLLPSTAYAGGSGSGSSGQTQGFGTSRPPTRGPSPLHSPEQQQQQSLAEPQQQQLQQPQHRLHDLSAFTTNLHTVYFDSKSLELYHGRLYLRPLTQTLKARWIRREVGGSGLGQGDESNRVGNYPDKVVLERKIYKEGWKGEKNVKDSLLIAGEKLPAYLAGAYNLSDALQQLYQYPALRQQMQQQEQQQQLQQQQQSPFAAYASSAVSDGDNLPGSQHSRQQQEDNRDAAAAAGIRVPQGVVLGASSSGKRLSMEEGPSIQQANGQYSLEPSAAGSSTQPWQQQQSNSRTLPAAPSLQQPAEHNRAQPDPQEPKITSNNPASTRSRNDSVGFEDAYLDPPVPTADQLSLFTEVQRLVTRKGLIPVLHCEVQRMLFAMPFDDRIKVTLDTDVHMSAVVEDDPLLALPSFSGFSLTQAPSTVRPYSSSGGGSSRHNEQQQQQSNYQQHMPAALNVAVDDLGPFGVPSPHVTAVIAAAEEEAYATWGAIFAADHNSRRSSYAGLCGSCSAVGSPKARYPVSARGKLVYSMPYALLKVSLRLPAGQSTIPGWLQQLMDNDALTPVEDWSKFVHGCSVLLPEIVRAVPYWIDDPLVDMSVQNIQAELDAQMTRREESQRTWLPSGLTTVNCTGSEHQQHSSAAQQASFSGTSRILSRIASSISQLIPGGAPVNLHGVRHSTSDAGYSSDRGFSGRHSSSGRTLTGGSGGVSPTERSAAEFAVGSYGRPDNNPISRLRYSSTGGISDNTHHQVQQQRNAATAAALNGILPASMRAGAAGGSGGGSKAVAWADDIVSLEGVPQLRSIAVHPQGGSSNSLQGLEQQQQQAGTSTSSTGQLVRRVTSMLRRKEQVQPLFRPEGRSEPIARRYKRWGHPVQLLECREFFHSESIFLDWLRLAITMASTAILLLGYSAMAYYNPLKRPALHVAEMISLLLLPASCIMVGYAMRVYIWRGKRLHSMRHKRVDDQVGPILMTLVFVTAMFAILLVNIADLYLLIKYKDKHASAGDDESGGDVTPAEGPDVYY